MLLYTNSLKTNTFLCIFLKWRQFQNFRRIYGKPLFLKRMECFISNYISKLPSVVKTHCCNGSVTDCLICLIISIEHLVDNTQKLFSDFCQLLG